MENDIGYHVKETLSKQSKYCYANTTTLKNKLDIKDEFFLEEIDKNLVTYKLSLIHLSQPIGNFNIEHYLNLHKYLFSNLYDFAGKIRNENICKGNTPFCRPEHIYTQLQTLLEQMKIRMPKVKSEQEFIEKLSYYFAEINMLHPFRDGNGRTEREYFRQFILYLNKFIEFGEYNIEYTQLGENSHQKMMEAIIPSVVGDNTKLEQLFAQILVNQKELKKQK